MTSHVEAPDKTKIAVTSASTTRGRGLERAAALMEALVARQERGAGTGLSLTRNNERARAVLRAAGVQINGSDPRGFAVDGCFYDDLDRAVLYQGKHGK